MTREKDMCLLLCETVSTAIGEREQAGIRKKPAPDSVLAALGVLGVTAEKAVYIGDSQVDVYTAQNSGMDGIAVTWGSGQGRSWSAQGLGFLRIRLKNFLSSYADTMMECIYEA